MLQLAVSGIRAVSLVATVVPGARFAMEAMENAFQGNEAVQEVLEAFGKLLESAGDIFAKIGNAIGVDKLAGVGEDKLKGSDFTNGFGIIPKVIGNGVNNSGSFAGMLKEGWDSLLKDPSKAVVPAGLAVGVMALDPKLAVALHDEGEKSATNIINVARQASQTAGKAAQMTGEMVTKLPEGGFRNAAIGATGAAQTTFETVGKHTGDLAEKMKQQQNMSAANSL